MSDERAKNLFAQGVTAYRAGQFDRAATVWRELLACEPDHLNALQLLGLLHYQRSRWPEGEACFRRVLQLRPDLAQSWFNLAKVTAAQGRWAEAEKLDREGLTRQPDDARATDHLGICLRELGRLEEAEAAHRRATELDPGDPAPINNLGAVQLMLGQTTAAAGSFARATEKDPSLAETHGNLGNALREMMGAVEAHEAFERAVAVRPDYALGWIGLLLNAQYHPELSRGEKFHLHGRFAAWKRSEIGTGDASLASRPPGPRCHIGYVSSELYQHAVAHFLRPIFRHHDRTRFEISVFSNTYHEDAVTAGLRAGVDHWHSVCGLSDAGATALIRKCHVDILVDLNGHSGFSRLGVFARKAAPIQVTYLGYPDTTGLSEIDYRLTDDVADPPGQGDEFYAETLWRLPAPAWCYEPPPEAPPAVVVKPAHAPVVFGCFNNSAKLNVRLLGWWSEILRSLPDSRLVLKARTFADPAVCAKVRKIFSDQGIEGSRIELKPWTPTAAGHLAEYLAVDIALDTYPYHGTTTTCDALWMGVPVMTLAGKEHRSRVGVSLLTAVGLQEWVADSPADYVVRAVELARDRARLTAAKAQLRSRMAASPLVDGRAFTAKLEAAFAAMIRTREATQPVAMPERAAPLP